MNIHRKFRKIQDKLKKKQIDFQLRRIERLPRFREGYTNIFGKPFKFHDGLSFAITYREIFRNQLYHFQPGAQKSIILDCGANMGLSVLYFSLNYPKHTIIAFEPDKPIFKILKENIERFNLQNVQLIEKAVWNGEEVLRFFSDHGMGGRVETEYAGQTPVEIETVRLKDFLTSDVDFLKIDIEGAEGVVLNDCEAELKNLTAFFFEYHNDIYQPQTLHQLLELVKKAGFHYYIKESWTRRSPFDDKDLVCEKFDMAINIFCYKNE